MNNKLINFLFRWPEKNHHVREIARKCNLSPNTVIAFSKKLSREGILKIKRKANLLEVGVDMESRKYSLKKMFFNLSSMYDSGLVDFIKGYYSNPKAIIVFGSYRRGEDISTSDIDIAVITSKKKRPELSRFEKKLNRSIQLFPVSLDNVSKEFFNNLINGFVLEGHISK